MRLVLLAAALLLAACAVAPPLPAPAPPPQQSGTAPLPSPSAAADNFVTVVERVEPIAERICRAEAPRLPCDFQIVVDSDPRQPPNAFQTIDRAGRPIVAFTIALIADARNQDEIAFILGHEAAHHIRDHIPRTQASAAAGAVLAGVFAEATGANQAGVRRAQDFGAELGARRYSKDFELEADALGTVIAYRAGYDPARGAAYFNRIADPGNMFLGTHPPNAARQAVVGEVLRGLR